MKRPWNYICGIYAQIIKYYTRHLVLDIVALRRLKILQIDVRSELHNGELEEELYGANLRGLGEAGSAGKVLGFHNTLFRLRWAANGKYNYRFRSLVKMEFIRNSGYELIYT